MTLDQLIYSLSYGFWIGGIATFVIVVIAYVARICRGRDMPAKAHDEVLTVVLKMLIILVFMVMGKHGIDTQRHNQILEHIDAKSNK